MLKLKMMSRRCRWSSVAHQSSLSVSAREATTRLRRG